MCSCIVRELVARRSQIKQQSSEIGTTSIKRAAERSFLTWKDNTAKIYTTDIVMIPKIVFQKY